MSLADALLPEFDREMSVTREVLSRLPDDRMDWRPHAKSATTAELGSHIATLVGWGVTTMQATEFDFAPPGAAPWQPPIVRTRAEMLAIFDANVTAARAALATAGDDAMRQPWTLKKGGQTIFSLPRHAVLRSFVLSHTIHHRAQLALYLRLNDLPVPSIYGPSADEGQM